MKIGTIDIERPLLLAPMEDVTDLPFRLICKELGADIVYTEFVNSEGLIRHSEKTKSKMFFREEERPFGIQLYGGLPESMKVAAEMATSLNPDIIDINCGCWVKNVVKNGAGSDLLRDLPRMEQIIKAVASATHLPVTVKTRLGWDDNSIKIIEVAKLAEYSGARAITIHCRTRSQGHKGEADYSWIPKVKEAVSIPVIANGSFDTPEKIKWGFDTLNCDGVMIGRGALDNPWIFTQAKQFQKQLNYENISFDQRFYILKKHLLLSIEYKGEKKGIIEFRKYYSGYLKSLPNAAKIRATLMLQTNYESVIEIIDSYKNQLSKNTEQINQLYAE